MQQFTVPQFIDVEDKVIGPLSIRQFIILIAGAIFCVIFYKVFDFTLFLFSSIITILLAAMFAFVKVGGMEFHFFLLNLLITLSRPSLRVWNHWWVNIPEEKTAVFIEPQQQLPRIYDMAHLNKLSLIVDTKGYYTGKDDTQNIYKVDDNLDLLID